jgi:hypothetical protein
MDADTINPMPVIRSPVARLRRLARAPSAAVEEHCELCAARIPAEHQHLLALQSRKIVCSCDACAILFDSHQAGRYRRVPREITWLRDFDLPDELWESLAIPINLAFFSHSSAAGHVVAMYPSPGGPMESLLPLDAWSDLVAANPACANMRSDVEALLINRTTAARDALIVPIDQCYRLVGVIRTHWRGLSGGSEVWGAIAAFFDDLHRRCQRPEGPARA